MLKRVVVKEELVALTGDWLSAMILNQFLYWSERTKDTDDYLKEERKRAESGGYYDTLEALDKIPLVHGWIYKKSSQLAEELMGCASEDTIRRRIRKLVSMGFLQERRNPRYRWDRTLQYRPDLVFIQQELEKLGYALEGYKLHGTNPAQSADSKPQPAALNPQPAAINPQPAAMKPHGAGAIPETTSETTSQTNTEKSSSSRQKAKNEPDAVDDDDISVPSQVNTFLAEFIKHKRILNQVKRAVKKHGYTLTELECLKEFVLQRGNNPVGLFTTMVCRGQRAPSRRKNVGRQWRVE